MFQEVAPRLANARMAINYGFDKIRFLTPVKSGSRIRGHFKTTDVQAKTSENILITTEVSIEIEGEKHPALIAHWLGMTILEKQESK